MKPLFLLILLLLIKVSFSQSKKEQIELLTNRVDSLNQVVSSQGKIINDKISQISVLNAKITNLESSISSLHVDMSKLNLEIQGNKNEILAKSQQLSNLQKQLKTKTDSLSLVLSELEKLKPAPKPLIVNNTNTNSNATNQVTQTGSFKSVKIGTQIWMTENLNVSTFRNGEPIPEAKTDEEWKAAGTQGKPAWCYYDNDSKNGAKYGKLYNWYAVNDPRGLAPEGWHVPNDEEWETLENYLGDDASKKMKSTSGWDSFEENVYCKKCLNWNDEYRAKTACHACKDERIIGRETFSGNGTNSSGFSGLPGGLRNYNGSFYLVGDGGYWWSSSVPNAVSAWSRSLYYDLGDVTRNNNNKEKGFSVRCLRD